MPTGTLPQPVEQEPPQERGVRTTSVRRGRDNSSNWPKVIGAVNHTLGLYALIVLATEGGLGVLYATTSSGTPILVAMLSLFALVVISVTVIALKRPEALWRQPTDSIPRKMSSLRDDEKQSLIDKNKTAVLNADAPALSPDGWTRQMQELRPLLGQASRYSMPAYFLDTDLNVIDWNVAFELIFKKILHKIRCRHVNHFIAELANCGDVFDHARDFTNKVQAGELPLVDMEPLVYDSDSYGVVTFEKIATQLTDASANLKAWAVGLMLKEIDWERFNSDLLPRLREHKLWSIYSVSYDAVLLEFPPYSQLIEEVIQAVNESVKRVLDIGAGTGNVTAALLSRGHRVTALENNQPMLDKLMGKRFRSTGGLTISNNSVDDLHSFQDETFDAVVSVNVLYALDDPSACIRHVARILKPGGVFAFSTTHSETDLEPLLKAIEKTLRKRGVFDAKEEHYRRVYEINKDIEGKIAKRYSREEYKEWLEDAGLEIFYENQSSYEGAVMVVHCRKGL